jgi:hypothetical protein
MQVPVGSGAGSQPFDLPNATYICWYRYFNATFPVGVFTMTSTAVPATQQVVWGPYLNTSTSIQFVINETGAGSPGGIGSTAPTNDGKWHFTAFRFGTANGNVNKAWFDGITGTATNTSAWSYPTDTLYNFFFTNGNTNYFVNTTMDIFCPMVFNAQLADWQVWAIFNGQDPRRIAGANLFGFWAGARSQLSSGFWDEMAYAEVGRTPFEGFRSDVWSAQLNASVGAATRSPSSFALVDGPKHLLWDEGVF